MRRIVILIDVDPAHRHSPAGSEREFWRGVDYSSRFFARDADVQRALRKLAAEVEAAQIPYAIAGGMALNWHGYRRVTDNVDILLTREGADAFKRRALSIGYVENGSKGLRDTENNVPIDVLLAGDYPGDGKPKPVRFPIAPSPRWPEPKRNTSRCLASSN